MKKAWLAAMAAVVLVMPVKSYAGTVYTTAQSDGLACYQTWMGGNDRWAVTDGAMMGGYYYYYGGADRQRNTPVMMFSLASYAGLSDVSATLDFYVSGGEHIDWGYVRFYDANTNGTVTYNSGAGGTRVAGGDLVGTGWYSIDVSSQVQSAINKGYDWATFNINMADYDMSVSVVASEGAVGEYAGMAPRLTVVPEPATVTLLGAGLLSFLRRRRA